MSVKQCLMLLSKPVWECVKGVVSCTDLGNGSDTPAVADLSFPFSVDSLLCIPQPLHPLQVLMDDLITAVFLSLCLSR